jgi:hypothetical protein
MFSFYRKIKNGNQKGIGRVKEGEETEVYTDCGLSYELEEF